ncbi:hypothetical protein BZA05DRAFT_419171 [Tricharina praecox]|uniref:uncharacterized protein n=1 Tax=Tricharina praecox TaxID=43433 RepID=UPI002220BD01|nr:uncharacterized protein BZA05DRAFT_419171 [Tricharina praecox]KAI5850654.1 hypothetical protein BZA05DRAFT_419171 [Tricharina praecox]
MVETVYGGGKGATSTLFAEAERSLRSPSPSPWSATSPPPNEGPARPSIVMDATILVAMHDFEARSPDELTLHKGEQIEVIERDEEFNDGWYMGRSLATNETGLFPQVYTTNPDTTVMHASPAISTSSSGAPSSNTIEEQPTSPPTVTPAALQPPKSALPDLQESHPSASSYCDAHPPSPAHSADGAPTSETPTPPLTVEKGRSTPSPKRASSIGLNGKSPDENATNFPQGLRSPVVEDTLSDIEEALSEITQNRRHRANKAIRDHNRRHSASMPPPGPDTRLPHASEMLADSSSEYSNHDPSVDVFSSDDDHDEPLDLPFANADEVPYTKLDVMKWSPADVSQYLQSRQIPPASCRRFEEEEVTGAILLQLEMSHLKDELKLGSFGKRFEVWKEIEHLVKNLRQPATKPRSGSDAAARLSTVGFTGHNRQRSSTVGTTALPQVRNQPSRPLSRQHQQQYQINVQEANTYESGASSLKTPVTSSATIPSEVSSPTSPISGIWEKPRSPPLSPPQVAKMNSISIIAPSPSPSQKRLSAQTSPSTGLNVAMSASAAVLTAGGIDNHSHRRESSFDKSWLGSLVTGPPRPATATGMREQKKHKTPPSVVTRDSVITGDGGVELTESPVHMTTERSYFSSGEATKERKVLHKKNTVSSQSSADGQTKPAKGNTSTRRHSRIASAGAEAIRRTSASTLSALSYHKSGKERKRKSRSFSGDVGLSDYELEDASTISRAVSPATFAAVPYVSRSLTNSVRVRSTIVENTTPPVSPGRTSTSTGDGSTPSLTVTMDGDAAPDVPAKAERQNSKKVKDKKIRTVSSGSELRNKSKKQTTAFQKGLREITPAEAAKNGDYSGWMKKRGSSGVGAWKSRFFVLNGRRLSYFYSLNDKVEQGLIDITSHKVLSATDDRLVGLHAAIAAVASPVASPRAAGGSPLSPGAGTPVSPGTPAKEDSPNPAKKKEKDQGWFTFKLVPPAPGAAKGVTFTQPRLHYFATDTRDEGKKWMAAMMKATIDRDETKPVITSYNAKTISLSKARALRARPPDLSSKEEGLGIALDSLGISVTDIGEEADVEDEEAGGASIKSIPEEPESEIKEDTATTSTTSTSVIEGSELSEHAVIDHSMFEQPNVSQDGKPAAGILQVQAIGIVG